MFISAGENWNSWNEDYKVIQCNLVAPTASRALRLYHAYNNEKRQPCSGCHSTYKKADIYEPVLPTVIWLCHRCYTKLVKSGDTLSSNVRLSESSQEKHRVMEQEKHHKRLYLREVNKKRGRAVSHWWKSMTPLERAVHAVKTSEGMKRSVMYKNAMRDNKPGVCIACKRGSETHIFRDALPSVLWIHSSCEKAYKLHVHQMDNS